MRKLLNEELGRIDAKQAKEAEKNPIVIVLDNVRSMHNVGSAFRTADAFLCEKIMLCGITAKPPHREIHKTALGATDSVAWEYLDKTSDAVISLRKRGYKIISVEQADQSTSLEQYKIESNEKLALIFGNEVKGVTDEIVENSDCVIEIPQFGAKHSINVSVSIGIVIWDLISKLKFKS
jgi:tRNA G18 (ribose-2'-O)-methylase SpoU